MIRWLVAVIALMGLDALQSAAVGQRASIPASANKVQGAIVRPINLQVLPKDLGYAEVAALMSRYSRELGVQCVFCHAQNPRTQEVNFASDQSPAKLVARVMIGMVRDINEKYLSQVSDQRYAVPISCGNCHQGQTFPPPFDAGPSP